MPAGVEADLRVACCAPLLAQAAEAPAEEGGLGSTYSFRQRFYSTLPDTLDNQLRVRLLLGCLLYALGGYTERATTCACC